MFRKALLAATCIVTAAGFVSTASGAAEMPVTGPLQLADNSGEKAGLAKTTGTKIKPTHQVDGMVRASAFIGEDVTNGKGERVGTVDDLIVSDGDRVFYAVLSVGGFLGVGEKLVAVPFEELKIGTKDVGGLIMYDTTKEKLKAQPSFHYAVARDESSRERFMKSAGQEVDRWKRRIDENMNEAKKSATEMKKGASKRIDSAWTKVQAEWTALKNASADAWDDAKMKFDQAMAELERAWDDATSS
jgi:sporulation protein YlmC with PRC-barrel domain